jgi:tight adherence protein C
VISVPALLAIAFTTCLCATPSSLPSQIPLRLGEKLLQWIRRNLSFSNSEKLREQLRMAGLRAEWHSGAYVATRILLPVLALGSSTFLPQFGFFGALMLVFIAYLLPDFWLNSMIRRRREQIRLALPDTLDLLVICVEAGLGMDQALYRVGSELAIRHKAMSEEITQINLEQRAGKPRLEVWRSMAKRTKLEDMEAFVAMLWQSERFGTPIIRALATFAESLRTARRQQAEELAAKATVKLLFPLVLFIFPSMFIVLIGPAALNIMHNLGGLFD